MMEPQEVAQQLREALSPALHDLNLGTRHIWAARTNPFPLRGMAAPPRPSTRWGHYAADRATLTALFDLGDVPESVERPSYLGLDSLLPEEDSKNTSLPSEFDDSNTPSSASANLCAVLCNNTAPAEWDGFRLRSQTAMFL